jgi:hypothetical protein
VLANLEATTFVDALGSDPCKNHLTVRCMLANKVACSLCLYVLAPLLSPGPPVSFQLARAPLSMSGRPRIGCVSRAYYRTMLLKVRFRIIGMLKVGALTFVGSLLNGPGRPNSSLPYSLDRPVWRLSRIQIRRAPRPPCHENRAARLAQWTPPPRHGASFAASALQLPKRHAVRAAPSN